MSTADKRTKARSVPSVDVRGALLIPREQLPAFVGVSYRTVSRLMATGGFPPPRQLSPARVAWLRADLESWASTRPVSSMPSVQAKVMVVGA